MGQKQTFCDPIGTSAKRQQADILISRHELAEFILGLDTPIRANGVIAEFDSCIDRSNLMSVPGGLGAELDNPHEQVELIMIGEQ
jgi:hypothetical protein